MRPRLNFCGSAGWVYNGGFLSALVPKHVSALGMTRTQKRAAHSIEWAPTRQLLDFSHHAVLGCGALCLSAAPRRDGRWPDGQAGSECPGFLTKRFCLPLRETSMRNLIVVAQALFLAACASTGVDEVRAPDGSIVKSVKCVSDSGKCMAAASESCGGGTYRVLDSSSNAGGALADLMPGPFTWYRMHYVCGPSDGKMPTFAFRGSTYTPPPVVAPRSSRTTTTNCQRIGDQVNCTTY